MENLGKKAKDKISGYKGVIIGVCTYLYSPALYGIVTENSDSPKLEWIEAARIEFLNDDYSPLE